MIPSEIVSRMIEMANREGLAGREVRRIYWLPPQTASSDPIGFFAIEHEWPRGGSGVPIRPDQPEGMRE